MHDAAVQNGSSRRRPAILADRIPLYDFDPFRRVAKADRNPINPSILPVDEALVRAAEADRIFHHVLQYRLEVERRAADDLEDFAGRRVLLQGLGKPLFQLGAGFAVAANARQPRMEPINPNRTARWTRVCSLDHLVYGHQPFAERNVMERSAASIRLSP